MWEEFAGAALGDGRLNIRLVKLTTRFADKPPASIPGTCSYWPEMQAAYRFFKQLSDQKRKLGWQGILAKKAIPNTASSIREVVHQIAMLGGFLGMQRLRDFVEGMEHIRAIYDAK